MLRSILLLSVLAVFASLASAVCPAGGDSNCLAVVNTVTSQNSGVVYSLTLIFDYVVQTGVICSLSSGIISRTNYQNDAPANEILDPSTFVGTVTVKKSSSGKIEATNLQATFTTTEGGHGSIGSSNANAIQGGYGTLAELDYTSTTFTVAAAVDGNPQLPDNCGAITGDPVFHGFHGQIFIVKGEHGRVFNLLSSPDFLFNNRFVQLSAANESMTASEMRTIRASYRHSKLLDLVAGDKKASADTVRPPVTTAWSHPGTYMGESGLRLGESRLYVAPGEYQTGFASVTLDGKAVPVSSRIIELDGDMTVSRPSAYKLRVTTPHVKFTLVNSANFINIEHIAINDQNAQLTGLLGQTANDEWEVVKSAEWREHLENDFKLASDDLFGNDFEGQQL